MQTQQQKREFYEFEAAQLRLTMVLQLGQFVSFLGSGLVHEDHKSLLRSVPDAMETAKAMGILKELAEKEGVLGIEFYPKTRTANKAMNSDKKERGQISML